MALSSVVNSGCASVSIPDINTYVTLPASGNGHGITTLSKKQQIIPKEKWELMRARGIVLMSEDWAKLKFILLKNCLSNSCKDTAGALDDLFYSINDGLNEIMKKKK